MPASSGAPFPARAIKFDTQTPFVGFPGAFNGRKGRALLLPTWDLWNLPNLGRKKLLLVLLEANPGGTVGYVICRFRDSNPYMLVFFPMLCPFGSIFGTFLVGGAHLAVEGSGGNHVE